MSENKLFVIVIVIVIVIVMKKEWCNCHVNFGDLQSERCLTLFIA